MRAYALEYILGAAVNVVVYAENEEQARERGVYLADACIFKADDLLAEHATDVVLLEPAYLSEVEEVDT